MVDVKELVIACIIVAIVSFFLGGIAEQSSIQKDCQRLGSFYYFQSTFKCEKKNNG